MAREVRKPGIRWRLWLWMTLAAVVSVSTAVGALKAMAYIAADPRFALSADSQEALTIQGATYADRAKIRAVFAADFGRGIFSAPLAERRRRLLALDWVQDASVSRVLPNRLVARIRERKPVAFASLPSGGMLVDAEGALLPIPPRSRFAFPVLDGLRAEDSPARRREAMDAFLRFERDMGYLANDVSDPGDLRIVARVKNRAVELILGDEGFASRYQNFVSHYDEIRKESPDAGTFDLRLDDRITARK